MGQIAVGEAAALITDPDLNSVAVPLTGQFHIPRTASVHCPQVAQGIFEALPVGGDHAVVGPNRDRPPFQLGSTSASLCHLHKQITNGHRLPVETSTVLRPPLPTAAVLRSVR